MLTQDETFKMHYYERIIQRKWKWILSNLFLFCCVGFLINCIIQVFEIGKIEMSIKEFLISMTVIFIPSVCFVLFWFNHHKKLYKELKQKEE